jgi:hypothetical protein
VARQHAETSVPEIPVNTPPREEPNCTFLHAVFLSGGYRRDFASTFRRHGEGTDAPSHTRPSQAGAFYESALGGSLLAQLSRNMRRAWLRPGSAGISGSVAVMLADLLGRAHASGFWRRQPTFARVAGEGPSRRPLCRKARRRPWKLSRVGAHRARCLAGPKGCE